MAYNELHGGGVFCEYSSGPGRQVYEGIRAEAKETVPQALYFPVDSTKIKLTVGTIGTTCFFLSDSPHRLKLPDGCIETIMLEHQKRRLKPPCRTRWVEGNETYITLRELLHPVVRTLDMTPDEGEDSGVRPNELRSAFFERDFVVSLFVMERFAALFLPLPIQLQSKDLDISRARETVDSTAGVLEDSRKTVGPDFDEMYRRATVACAGLEIDVSLPWRYDRQTHQDNYAVDSVEDYSRVCMYLPYLDQLTEEFRAPFEDIRENALYFNSSDRNSLREALSRGRFRISRSRLEM